MSRLTDATFAGMVGTETGIAVVDFWAAWCPPCRVLSAVLGSLADEMGETYRFHELDTDLNPVTAATYGVRSLPTVIVFSEGRELGRIVGALPKEAFRRRLEGIVAGSTAGMADD